MPLPIIDSPYFVHLRPRSWPTVAGHVLAGALMGAGPDVFEFPQLWCALLACFLWAVCLNGGTLAFNSAHDRDEGDIGFLNNPPMIPRHLGAFGFWLMAAGLAAGVVLGWAFFAIYALSVFMSWIYSAPPLRLKTRGGWDVVINMIGYGALTALAGWLAVAGLPRGADWCVFAGFAFLFGVVYPMTQFYQMEDDIRSGARTLALMLGVGGSMLFIHTALLAANACWTVTALGRDLPAWAWVCLVAQAAIWLVFSMHWWVTFKRYPHQKGFYVSMGLWAVSNACLVAVFGFAGKG